MASSRLTQSNKPVDLDLTIVSAKHLKNVNWRNNGELKPYAIFWVDPERRLATKSDDSGSTRPVWNEHFTLPLSLPLSDAFLTLEIFHSKPSETPKPLVGSVRIPLRDVADPDDSSRIRTYELLRPSGRPQGKIRIKLAIRERPLPPDYHSGPPSGYYYGTAPPPPVPAPVRSMTPPPPPSSVRDYRGYHFSGYTAAAPPPPAPAHSAPGYPYSFPDAYSGYYGGYFSSAPPPPTPHVAMASPPLPQPFFDRGSGYGSPSPSAPVEYVTPYEKSKSGKMGLGTGLAVGAVAGALGGLALEEGLKYEEGKIAERVENDVASRPEY